MVSAMAISSERSLERVSNIFADHKGHMAFIEGAHEKFAKQLVIERGRKFAENRLWSRCD